MRKVERERHIVGSLIAGVAEHHALVAGTLVFSHGAFHTAVDVLRLLVQSREYATRFGVKLQLAAGVAYAANHATSHLHKVDVGIALHLAGNKHLSGGNESFASHLRLRVVGEKAVENCITDLVSHLVGVALRY